MLVEKTLSDFRRRALPVDPAVPPMQAAPLRGTVPDRGGAAPGFPSAGAPAAAERFGKDRP